MKKCIVKNKNGNEVEFNFNKKELVNKFKKEKIDYKEFVIIEKEI